MSSEATQEAAVSASANATQSLNSTYVGGENAQAAAATNSTGGSGSKREVQIGHKDFPEAKTLLISCKRTRPFLERTARELLAGGTNYIVLSALGDAIPLCILLEASLQEKNVAKSIRIETNSDTSKPSRYATPGLRIVMQKDPNFKGSRISPGYVSFCGPTEEPICWDAKGAEYLCSIYAGSKDLAVRDTATEGSFFDVLNKAEIKVEEFAAIHKALLGNAITENTGKADNDVRAVRLADIEEKFPDIKLGFCRPCNFENPSDPRYLAGSVFLTVFKEKHPFNNSYNMGMIYLVSPQYDAYANSSEFLRAVSASAENVMTTLCDHNGFARRELNKVERSNPKVSKYERITSCRVDLFSDDLPNNLDISRHDVAKYILEGLARGYRHGPAPRINFTSRDSLFEQVWEEAIGREHVTTIPKKQQSSARS